MAKNYIYSTSSNHQRFRVYTKMEGEGLKGGRPAVVREEIFIKGRANVTDVKTMDTPQGVVTEVTDAQLEALQEVRAFQRMVKDGFLKISKGRAPEPEKASKDMQKKDGSAQMTKEDFVEKKKKSAPGAQAALPAQGKASETPVGG